MYLARGAQQQAGQEEAVVRKGQRDVAIEKHSAWNIVPFTRHGKPWHFVFSYLHDKRNDDYPREDERMHACRRDSACRRGGRSRIEASLGPQRIT